MTKRPWNINDALSRIGEKHGETLRRLADGEGAAWTDKDTEALRSLRVTCGGCIGRPGYGACDCYSGKRAADHIEDLERQLVEAHALSFSLGGKLDRARERIAELEAERVSAIRAIRDRATEMARQGFTSAGFALMDVAAELERKGERWPND